jgi:ABC-type nickel/cobalt efflux system permease component RcnA
MIAAGQSRGCPILGLDHVIVALGRGGSPLVVLVVALLLGLRHASDPDHLVAVSTLVATEPERPVRRASRLGLAWGLGHATTLVALGVPIVLADRYVPEVAQRAAEALVGVVIVALAVRLLRRWRAGRFHAHEHRHDHVVHRHLHGHAELLALAHEHGHEHVAPRTAAQAFGIGLVHGVGGSAAVGLLLLASIPGRSEALLALLLFAAATAVSMVVLSLGAAYLLARPAVRRRFPSLIPLFATCTAAFGVWYALGAVVG